MFLDTCVRPAVLTLASDALVVLPVDSLGEDTDGKQALDAIQPPVSNCEAVAGALRTQRDRLLHAPTGSRRAGG